MTMMVMNRSPKKSTAATGSFRVSVAQAKSQLSALIRTVERQPVVIQNRGRDVARLMPVGNEGEPSTEPLPFVSLLNRIEALKKRSGIRGVKLQLPKAAIDLMSPFGDSSQ